MKDQVHDYLTDWTEVYIKSKDAIKKTITSINKDKDYNLIVKHKDKQEFFIIESSITNIGKILNKSNKDEIITLVILNSKKNFDIIIENWKKLIDLKTFKIVFVNPFSETEKKWIINPNLHHRICDESSLKTGLKSMFDTVVSTDEEKIKKTLKNQKKYI